MKLIDITDMTEGQLDTLLGFSFEAHAIEVIFDPKIDPELSAEWDAAHKAAVAEPDAQERAALARRGYASRDEVRPCRKCGGGGYIEAYSYHLGGVCFRCDGTGDEPPPGWHTV